MATIDNKLQLLLGRPISVNDFLQVRQFKLGEIVDMGFETYLYKVSFLLRGVDEFMKMLVDSPNYMDLYMQKNQLTALYLHVMFCENDAYREMFIDSLSFVLGVEPDSIVIGADGVQYILSDNDVKLITEIDFDKIVETVKISNGFTKADTDDGTDPYDEKTKRMLEKMKMNRERVEQIKAKERDDNRDISDLVSAVTVMSNSINKLNVHEYTLYQIYDENSRLYTIENYRMSVKSSMFGADNEITDWGKPQ